MLCCFKSCRRGVKFITQPLGFDLRFESLEAFIAYLAFDRVVPHGDPPFEVLNGKQMVIDDLWRNGTAPAAYWLWEKR